MDPPMPAGQDSPLFWMMLIKPQNKQLQRRKTMKHKVFKYKTFVDCCLLEKPVNGFAQSKFLAWLAARCGTRRRTRKF
jgi:hypothetical protein